MTLTTALRSTEPKFHPVADMFPLMRHNHAQWIAFCSSIREEGLLEPIVMHEGMILDGRNRFLACIEAGVAPWFVEFSTLGVKVPPHIYAFDRNFQRRDLTPDQRVSIYQAFFEFDQREALRVRKEAGKQGGRGHRINLPTKSSEVSSDVVAIKDHSHESRVKLAQAAKVSERKAQQAINVAKADPELLKQVQAGKMPLHKAAAAVKQQKQPAQSAKPRAGTKAAVQTLVKLCVKIEQDIDAAVASVPKEDRPFVASSLLVFAYRLRESIGFRIPEL